MIIKPCPLFFRDKPKKISLKKIQRGPQIWGITNNECHPRRPYYKYTQKWSIVSICFTKRAIVRIKTKSLSWKLPSFEMPEKCLSFEMHQISNNQFWFFMLHPQKCTKNSLITELGILRPTKLYPFIRLGKLWSLPEKSWNKIDAWANILAGIALERIENSFLHVWRSYLIEKILHHRPNALVHQALIKQWYVFFYIDIPTVPNRSLMRTKVWWLFSNTTRLGGTRVIWWGVF